MKTRISVQERLKDLRVEQGLNLEELAQKTGISKSALGSYENDNDEYKEINHGSLLKLADFYQVSVDYLLGLTNNRKYENTPIEELHLSDEVVELLKSERFNNRLLCEIISHEKFRELLADAEIYVDGIATMHFHDTNSSLAALRATFINERNEKKFLLENAILEKRTRIARAAIALLELNQLYIFFTLSISTPPMLPYRAEYKQQTL